MRRAVAAARAEILGDGRSAGVIEREEGNGLAPHCNVPVKAFPQHRKREENQQRNQDCRRGVPSGQAQCEKQRQRHARDDEKRACGGCSSHYTRLYHKPSRRTRSDATSTRFTSTPIRATIGDRMVNEIQAVIAELGGESALQRKEIGRAHV